TTGCNSYNPRIDLPEGAPDALVANKTYDPDASRRSQAARHSRRHPAEIDTPRRSLQQAALLSAQVIERVHDHLKINHAVATRYDQLAIASLESRNREGRGVDALNLFSSDQTPW